MKRDENIVRRQAKTLQQFWQGSMETKGKESDSGVGDLFEDLKDLFQQGSLEKASLQEPCRCTVYSSAHDLLERPLQKIF